MKQGLYFVASYSNYGMGIAVEGYDFLITSANIVNNANNVVVKDNNGQLFISSVLFVDYALNIAFVRMPIRIVSYIELSKIDVSFEEQEVKLVTMDYCLRIQERNHMIIATSEIDNVKFKIIETQNSFIEGAPTINYRNELIGLVSYITTINSYAATPMKYILNLAEEFACVNRRSLRCNYCHKIVSLEDIDDDSCPFCNSEMFKHYYFNDNPQNDNLNKLLENLRQQTYLNNSFECYRIGKHFAELLINGISLYLNFDDKTNEFVLFKTIDLLQITNVDVLGLLLLEQNHNSDYLNFSVKEQILYISSFRMPSEYIDFKHLIFLINHIFEKYEFLKNRLNEL